jgi:Ran GTPase-activating protein (RanGAP) involved in mRNA processing and transport
MARRPQLLLKRFSHNTNWLSNRNSLAYLQDHKEDIKIVEKDKPQKHEKKEDEEEKEAHEHHEFHKPLERPDAVELSELSREFDKLHHVPK